MSKYISAEDFFDIVTDSRIRLPKKISVNRKRRDIDRLFGWIETARSSKSYNKFERELPKGCRKIEEMKIKEDELLSIMSFCRTLEDHPEILHQT